MRSKKIIKLPKQSIIGVGKDSVIGNCTLTLHSGWYAFSPHELHDLLEQTFNAGVNWKEKYSENVFYVDAYPAETCIPNFIKYLKQIQNEKEK